MPMIKRVSLLNRRRWPLCLTLKYPCSILSIRIQHVAQLLPNRNIAPFTQSWKSFCLTNQTFSNRQDGFSPSGRKSKWQTSWGMTLDISMRLTFLPIQVRELSELAIECRISNVNAKAKRKIGVSGRIMTYCQKLSLRRQLYMGNFSISSFTILIPVI
jgi:hypothetical protein